MPYRPNRDSSKTQERRKARIAAGLCRDCGKRPLHTKSQCFECKDKGNARRCTPVARRATVARNAQLRKQGICYTCKGRKGPCLPGRKRCQYCKDMDDARLQRQKDQVFQAYGGYTCACCGEAETDFLTIDHIRNDGSTHRKSSTFNLYQWLRMNNFPEGYQVLCVNCNFSKGKRNSGGLCIHERRRRGLVS